MITFESGEGLSVLEILNFQKKGYPLYRTAHIGNLNFSALLLGKIGVPIYLHEDIPGNFYGYMPGYIIAKNNVLQLFNNTTLQAPQLVNSNLKNNIDLNLIKFKNDIVLKKSAISIHYYFASKIIKNTKLWSEYILENKLLLESTFNILVKLFPDELFANYIDCNGAIYKYESFQNNEFVFRNGLGIKTINSDQIVDIYIEYVCKLEKCTNSFQIFDYCITLKTTIHILLSILFSISDGKFIIFHFCGERMFEYMFLDEIESRNMNKVLNEMITEISKKTKLEKNNIRIVLIPTKNMQELYSDFKILYKLDSMREKITQYDCLVDSQLNKQLSDYCLGLMDFKFYNKFS